MLRFCEAAQEWEFSGGIGWDSKYVSEGRDNLEEGGLRYAEGAGAAGDWELGGCWSRGDSVDYEELNVWLARGFTIGEFDLAASYTYLDFAVDGSSDSEVALDIGTSVFETYAANLCTVYSEEADGYFFELSMEHEFAVSQCCTIVPYAMIAVNSGYVGGEPRGLNNAQVGVRIQREISEKVTAALFANMSMGIADGVGDLAWFGIRLEL